MRVIDPLRSRRRSEDKDRADRTDAHATSLLSAQYFTFDPVISHLK